MFDAHTVVSRGAWYIQNTKTKNLTPPPCYRNVFVSHIITFSRIYRKSVRLVLYTHVHMYRVLLVKHVNIHIYEHLCSVHLANTTMYI